MITINSCFVRGCSTIQSKFKCSSSLFLLLLNSEISVANRLEGSCFGMQYFSLIKRSVSIELVSGTEIVAANGRHDVIFGFCNSIDDGISKVILSHDFIRFYHQIQSAQIQPIGNYDTHFDSSYSFHFCRTSAFPQEC
jgi:hypothetical protein